MITELLTAPAKINWSLRVGALRSNGLHAITTDIQKTDLCDLLEIHIDFDRMTSQVDLAVEADSWCVAPTDESNLVIRAIRAFFEKQTFPAIDIRLRKQIPSEAGLGGGSADAAAVLLFLARHFPRPAAEVRQIATTLGSELAFFLSSAWRAQVTGTGERVSAKKAEAVPVLLCLPPQTRVPTGWAFGELDRLRATRDQPGTLPANDFEPLIFARYPRLAAICELFRRSGAAYAGLSGSGGTVFGAFTQGIPPGLAARLKAEGNWVHTGMTLHEKHPA